MMARLERSQSTRYNVPLQDRSRCGKCYFYFRQITTFVFSHIGLCMLLLGYTLFGALTFREIELENEQFQRRNVTNRRYSMVDELVRMTNQTQYFNEDDWKGNAKNIVHSFELDFVIAVKYAGFDGL